MTKPAKRSRSKTSWKGTGSYNKKNYISLGVLALVGLCLLIGVSRLFGFIASFSKPYHPDAKVDLVRNAAWDSKSDLNLIFKSDSVQILSLDQTDNQVTIIKLPQDTYVNTAFGFGKWPISSVYKLGQAEENPIGILLLERTLESIFAIPIDGYIITEDKISNLSADDFVSDIHQNPLVGLSYLNQIHTDLTGFDYLKVLSMIKNTRQDKVKTINLGESQITESILLPDGSRALGIDQPSLDQYIESQFEDSKVGQEAVTIGVFNTTNHPGLADMASRLITNLGGRVIFTANSQKSQEKTIVTGNPSYTKQRLEQIFAPQCINTGGLNCGVNPKELDSSRADLTIFLGEDYFQRFNERP